LSRLIDAEPGLSYLLSSLSDQLMHAAVGDAVPPANLGGDRPAQVLSHQALDRLSVQPLANPPFSATASALRRHYTYVNLAVRD
jgi:hypothetical protein